jgi:hypothetical protein
VVWGCNSPNEIFWVVILKSHTFGSNHIFWYIICIGRTFGLGCRRWVAGKKRNNTQNRYTSTIRGWSITFAPSRRIFTNFCTGVLGQRNQPCEVSFWSVEGSRFCGYPKFRCFRRKAKSSLTLSLALPRLHVILSHAMRIQLVLKVAEPLGFETTDF